MHYSQCIVLNYDINKVYIRDGRCCVIVGKGHHFGLNRKAVAGSGIQDNHTEV